MEIQHTAGIYRISNYDRRQVYYGSSRNVAKRINAHKHQLGSGEHHNRYLAYWQHHEGITYEQIEDFGKFTDLVEFCRDNLEYLARVQPFDNRQLHQIPRYKEAKSMAIELIHRYENSHVAQKPKGCLNLITPRNYQQKYHCHYYLLALKMGKTLYGFRDYRGGDLCLTRPDCDNEVMSYFDPRGWRNCWWSNGGLFLTEGERREHIRYLHPRFYALMP